MRRSDLIASLALVAFVLLLGAAVLLERASAAAASAVFGVALLILLLGTLGARSRPAGRTLRVHELLSTHHYRLAYDGEWQESFPDRERALLEARSVAERGTVVWVIRGRLMPRFEAAVPAPAEAAATRLWDERAASSLPTSPHK